MKRMTLFLMALFVMTVSELSAQTVNEYSRQTPPDYKHSNTRFGNYPGSYFSPRIEWGRPLATGQLQLLVILPLSAARESVELASRLDAKVDMITSVFPYTNRKLSKDLSRAWYLGTGDFYEAIPSEQVLNKRTTDFLSPAYRHNAIIIGKIQWTIIPEDIRKRILEKVKGGTALIFVSPWDVDAGLQASMKLSDGANLLAKSIKATVPLAELPLDMDLEPLYPDKTSYPPRKIGPLEIRIGKLGEGTVVFLQYNDLFFKSGKKDVFNTGIWSLYSQELCLTPFIGVDDDELFYNYYYSILSKAIIYATGRKSGVCVRPDAVDAKVTRKELPAAPLTFRVSCENRILSGTSIYYEIRDRNNLVVAKGEEEIKQKDGDIAFAPRFPVLKQGLYMADIWIKCKGTVLDWASAAVTVTDTSYLKSVVAEKEFFGRNEGIRGNITLKEPVPSSYKVVAELWDTYKRLEQRMELKGGDTKFSFDKIQYPLSRAYRIVCQVKSGDSVLDEVETWTGLPSNEVDEFQFISWDSGWNGKTKMIRMHLQKEYGITAYLDCVQYVSPAMLKQSADNLAKKDLKAWPLCGNFPGFTINEQFGEFQEGKWKETLMQRYLAATATYKRYGTLAYGIDSESGFSQDDAKWENPTALKDYRIYLKGRYSNIIALNKIWGSAFASFDDIGFISFMDAKKIRQPTRWLEQNLYKVDRFTGVAEYVAGVVGKLDPGARIGMDITHGGYDIPKLSKFVGAFIQSEVMQFDKDNDKARVSSGYWFGFYKGEQTEWHMRTKPWESLFLGGKALGWFLGNDTFTPDSCEPYLCFKQASEEINEIHSGLDRLLMSSSKRIDPILILWSNNSEIAGIYNPLETTWANARVNFINMLRRTGLDFQCVGEDFIEDKLQFGDKQRVLILPASQSISRKNVERIKAFANAGGLVIADYRSATMDEYLRPYGGDQPKAGAVAAKPDPCPTCKGNKQMHLGGAGDPFGNCPACNGTGVVLKGIEIDLKTSALDEVFNFTEKGIKKCGKGYGLFLAASPARDEWRAIRNTLVTQGGIKGDIEVLDILGNTRTDLQTYVFDNGPATFVGVLPDKTVTNPPGEEFILKTDKKMHIYNVRMHSYLGFSDSVTTGILPAQAKLFALLPARIDGIALESNKKEYRPGEVITLDIKIMPEALKDVAMAARVEVLKDNTVIPEYTKKLAIRGAANHHVPLALNQEKGEYTLRINEVISGNRQEMKITVR